MQRELFVCQRSAKVQFEHAASLHMCIHLGLKESIKPSTIQLGAVERQIGIFEKLFRVLAVGWRHCDANAATDHKLMITDHIGSPERFDQPACQHGRSLRLRNANLKNSELV